MPPTIKRIHSSAEDESQRPLEYVASRMPTSYPGVAQGRYDAFLQNAKRWMESANKVEALMQQDELFEAALMQSLHRGRVGEAMQLLAGNSSTEKEHQAAKQNAGKAMHSMLQIAKPLSAKNTQTIGTQGMTAEEHRKKTIESHLNSLDRSSPRGRRRHGRTAKAPVRAPRKPTQKNSYAAQNAMLKELNDARIQRMHRPHSAPAVKPLPKRRLRRSSR